MKGRIHARQRREGPIRDAYTNRDFVRKSRAHKVDGETTRVVESCERHKRGIRERYRRHRVSSAGHVDGAPQRRMKPVKGDGQRIATPLEEYLDRRRQWSVVRIQHRHVERVRFDQGRESEHVREKNESAIRRNVPSCKFTTRLVHRINRSQRPDALASRAPMSSRQVEWRAPSEYLARRQCRS